MCQEPKWEEKGVKIATAKRRGEGGGGACYHAIVIFIAAFHQSRIYAKRYTGDVTNGQIKTLDLPIRVQE